jgi:hypothetical protein
MGWELSLSLSLFLHPLSLHGVVLNVRSGMTAALLSKSWKSGCNEDTKKGAELSRSQKNGDTALSKPPVKTNPLLDLELCFPKHHCLTVQARFEQGFLGHHPGPRKLAWVCFLHE